MISLDQGLLFELPRDEAKTFFGCRTDEAAHAYVERVIRAGKLPVVDLDRLWQPLARCFGDGTLSATAGAPPLAWCLLGGKSMHIAPSRTICMVRPDMVRHVAEALESADEAWLQARVTEVSTEEDPIELSGRLAAKLWEVREAYQLAAKAGSAMVFAVDHGT